MMLGGSLRPPSPLQRRGELPDAAALYAEALEVYEDVLGEKHSSTADVVTNLGVLHRTMADNYKGMEKMLEVET